MLCVIGLVAIVKEPKPNNIFTTMSGFLLSQGRRFAASAPRLVNTTTRSFAAVGDMLPSVDLHQGFPPKKHNLADFCKDKSVILVGLPGAFTPT